MRRSELLFQPDNRPTAFFADLLKALLVPGDTLADIDTVLQERYFPKHDDGRGKERWELPPVSLEGGCTPEDFRGHLSRCGFLDVTKPTRLEYVYGTVPGALAPRSAVRMKDLIGAWKQGVRWKRSVLFGGERPLQADKENFEACCKAVGIPEERKREVESTWGVINPRTELDMMQFCWEVLPVPDDLRALPTSMVNAPMKPGKNPGDAPIRPDTLDPLKTWLTQDDPEPGSMLVSSGAPYGMAQSIAYEMVLEPEGFDDIEFFGHEAPDLPVENYLREVAGAVNRLRKQRGV